MSATEVLRRMLDERGVEYETYIEQPTGFEHVKWNFNEHGSADFNLEFGEPWLTMYGVISGPEQAIAATLGTGTCHNVWDVELTGRLRFQCSECGAVSLEITPRFCPVCGKKVVEPTENDVDAEVAQ